MESLLITLLIVETLVLVVVWRRKRTWKRRAIAASPTVWGEVRRLFIMGLRDNIDADCGDEDPEWPALVEDGETPGRGDTGTRRRGDDL